MHACMHCRTQRHRAPCAAEPPAAPPVPIAVIHAAETVLQKLHHSGRLLDVLVATGAAVLWPTATLRMLRFALLTHLEATSASTQPPRVRVIVVDVAPGDPEPIAPADDGAQHGTHSTAPAEIPGDVREWRRRLVTVQTQA